jgi:hypothetical protein
MFAHEGKLSLESANARPYKEDPDRLKGVAGDWVVYRTFETLRYAKVLTLMEGEQKDLEFYGSADGKTFTKLLPRISRFPTVGNLYGYKLPIKYELEGVTATNYLKIAFTGDAQISRVELRYGK